MDKKEQQICENLKAQSHRLSAILMDIDTLAKSVYDDNDDNELLESGFYDVCVARDRVIDAYVQVRETMRMYWLEKQSDGSNKWNRNTDSNKPTINHSVLMKTTHGIAEGEWQGGQWLQYRWSAYLKDDEILYWIEPHDLEKQ